MACDVSPVAMFSFNKIENSLFYVDKRVDWFLRPKKSGSGRGKTGQNSPSFSRGYPVGGNKDPKTLTKSGA